MSATDITMFCPACFADEGGGSWAHNVYKTDSGAYCTNCGNGSCVSLPKWAVESIRQQASWVGKRYYPHDEDRERHIERQALLSLVVTFPGRSATRLTDDPDPPSWNVSQIMPDGRQVQTIVRAPDEATAIRWSGLTYYSAEQLAAKRDSADERIADAGETITGEDLAASRAECERLRSALCEIANAKAIGMNIGGGAETARQALEPTK